MTAGITVHPVTPDRWMDFARLFEAPGSPHYCWCMAYRASNSYQMSKDQKREAMLERVTNGTPIGVLAYDGGNPVGWCSAAPRESYARLDRSRTMPRMDDAPTWTVLCFFVRRTHRRIGTTLALLQGAIKYAQEGGAQVIEGYPFDTAAISSTHRGHSSLFEAAGFRREGKRWVWWAPDAGEPTH